MQVTIEDVSAVEKKVDVVIPWDRVKTKLDEQYRQLGKRAKLKAFRPGKVPRNILEKLYGKDVNLEGTKALVQESFVAQLARKRGIVVMLALASLANAWSLGSATGPAPAATAAIAAVPAPAAASWKLLVVNVHLDIQDLRPLLQLIERESPDAVGIIELTPHAAEGLAVLAQRYPVSRVEPRDDPFGIGLWSRLPASQVDLVSMPPLGFPALQLHWAAPDPGSLWLVHPFPPIGAEATAWRDTQLRYTAGLIRGDEDAVLAGDLNATPWSSAYLVAPGSGTGRQQRAGMAVADLVWRGSGFPVPGGAGKRV